MAVKKKSPTLRWKKRQQSKLAEIIHGPVYDLQEWSEGQNKYVDVPAV